MSLLHMLFVAGSAAFFLPALASPANAFKPAGALHLRQPEPTSTPLNPGSPPTTPGSPGPADPPDCVASSLNEENREQSVYTFRVDPAVRDAAIAGGVTHIAVRQSCKAEDGFSDPVGRSGTENWGFAEYNTNSYEFTITLVRCKKKFGRYVRKYKVHMCKGPSKDDCRSSCGTDRERCKYDAGEKAVIIDDPVPWTCAVPKF